MNTSILIKYSNEYVYFYFKQIYTCRGGANDKSKSNSATCKFIGSRLNGFQNNWLQFQLVSSSKLVKTPFKTVNNNKPLLIILQVTVCTTSDYACRQTYIHTYIHTSYLHACIHEWLCMQTSVPTSKNDSESIRKNYKKIRYTNIQTHIDILTGKTHDYKNTET